MPENNFGVLYAPLVLLRAPSSYTDQPFIAPAFRAVELYDTDFANGFIEKSKYRGPPTAELEQLWFDLWNQAEVLIPSDRMAALNRTDLSDYMRAPDGEGDGYVGGLENYLRQYTWQLAGAYKEGNSLYAPKGSRKELRIHADHCIESLRITLMCHGDVSPVLIKMDNHYDPPRPSAEFSSHHRCRNFEQIMAWNEDHGLSTFNNPHHSHHHNHGGDE
ncbi:hypothetical protein TrVFT333_004721 [Trichoderma virens FT-333]|nr:hypothetical protein TrVFT333_004721 [Trichoderma virens FT-333]